MIPLGHAHRAGRLEVERSQSKVADTYNVVGMEATNLLAESHPDFTEADLDTAAVKTANRFAAGEIGRELARLSRIGSRPQGAKKRPTMDVAVRAATDALASGEER